MYNQQLLLDRIEATFQKHIGETLEFRTRRASIINSISINRTPFELGKYYISDFEPWINGSNFIEGCGKVLGVIKINEMSKAILVNINFTKLIEKNEKVYSPFETKILLDSNRVILRHDKLNPSPLNLRFRENEYSRKIVRPQEILPNRLFEQETYLNQ